MLVGPVAQPAVLGQAVAADARSGEDHIAVRGPHLDCLDDLDQVHAVPLGEQAPLVEEGQDGRPVGVLDDLGGFRLDGPVHHGQRELLGVQDFAEELFDPLTCFRVAAGADPPEVADRGDVLPPRHHPLETVGQQRLGGDPPGGEGLLHDRPGDELRGAGGHGRLDQRQAVRRDLLADGPHRGLQGSHLRLARAHVAEVVLGVVALHVDHDAVGQGQAIGVEGGGEGLLLLDAAGDHRIDLGVLGLHRRLAPVQERNFPVAPRAGPLAADHQLARLAGPLIHGVGDDGRHHRPDEADAHDHHHFFPLAPGLFGQFAEPGHLLCVVGFGRQRKLFAREAGGIGRHGMAPGGLSGPMRRLCFSITPAGLRYAEA